MLESFYVFQGALYVNSFYYKTFEDDGAKTIKTVASLNSHFKGIIIVGSLSPFVRWKLMYLSSDSIPHRTVFRLDYFKFLQQHEEVYK